MQPITLKARVTVDKKRRIMIDLPETVEPGEVELDVVVRPIEVQTEQYEPGSREWARSKLREAGLLAEDVLSQEELAAAEEMSEEEELELAKKFSGGRSIQELIDEDREERF